MSRQRRSVIKKPIIESDSDEDDIPAKKAKKMPEKDKLEQNESSSSESDIENYLQPVNKLDFSSSFFNLQKNNEEEFQKIEKTIFDGVSRLSDSSSDDENENNSLVKTDSKEEVTESKLNFQQLEDFTRKIEEAKLEVEKYNAKRKNKETNQSISNLLALGETKPLTLENIKEEDLHSSDFETDEDDWEEVKIKESQEEKSIIPKTGIEIQVGEMPETCKRKKGVDLLAAMKRRLNRIRKENQIYVHKVHLLCWVAHGNFLNNIINDSEILALALSLLPSDKCYPSDRIDLGYLEQIVNWYKKNIRLTEKSSQYELTVINSLKLQIKKKEAFSKNMYILMFIAILRSLGIQCRLALSFQVEPLRPPNSELHSESTKKTDNKSKSTSKKLSVSINTSKSNSANKQAKKVSFSRNSKSSPSSSNNTKETSRVSSRRKVNDEESKTKKEEKNSIEKGVSASLNEKKSSSKKSNKEKTVQITISKTKIVDNKQNEEISVGKGKQDKTSKTQTAKIEKKASSEKTNKRESAKISKTQTEEKKKNSNSDNKNDDEKKIRRTSTRQRTSVTKNNVENEKSESNNKNDNNTLTVDSNKRRSKSTSSNQSRQRTSVTKNNVENVKSDNKNDNNTLTVDNNKRRSKSTSSNQSSQTIKTRSKSESIIKVKLPKYTKNKTEIPQLDGANDEKQKSKKDKPNLQKLKSQPTTLKRDRVTFSVNNEDSESEFSPSPPKKSSQSRINFSKLKPTSSLDVKNDIINLIKGRISEQKAKDRSKLVKKPQQKYYDSDSDSDYVPEAINKKSRDSDSDVEYFIPKPKVKRPIKVKKGEDGKLKVVPDSDYEKKKKKGVDMWIEVFLDSEEKWISADVIRGQVHCVNELFMRASHPVSYVVAWNNDNTLKDVTMRYCKNFNTVTRKLRIDAKWWEESLKPFLEKSTARSKEEDDDLRRQQLDQPLPNTISEYKNHPLYALNRHLLKFEAIYPPDIVPLGYVRGEPVYPRNSVYTCKSRDIWIKDAKVVKPGETPYKIVKARPKYDRLSNKTITDQLLEIFGIWQTNDYDPPTAENGKVPRNAFGNVDLFKPCMLPKGTVHLNLPGLNRICKKLNIDCAQAISGFDFHGGWSHPVMEGFVICKEFEETVTAAWAEEQEQIEKRENEKIEKRVYTNWKKLIKGLLIRERLKARYDFGGESSGNGKGKKNTKSKGPRFATKKRRNPLDSDSDDDN